MTRAGDERGSGLVELTWLVVLLLVPLLYVVLTVFETQRAAYAVTSASQAAGRAFALAPDTATADSRARATVELTLADQGVDSDRAAVSTSCSPSCLVPGSVVEVTVTTAVPLPLLPAMFGEQPSVSVSSTQLTPLGDFQESR
ncbi:hypothetical protein KLP28_09880 [Nocardioidaceae bacterium]|nr:hypothetical protein KLP28_09880 [Nocardioidaceae bacterium]